jgi:uncharacterized repeat protein (TIGR01451 family)
MSNAPGFTSRSRFFGPTIVGSKPFGFWRRQLAILLVTALFLVQATLFITPHFLSTVYADTGAGSISLTTFGSAVTENFDSLANTGTTNTTLPTGWYITEQGGGARDNEQYGADNGVSGTGDIYSYGTTASTERALGGLLSGTLVPFFGAKFTNNTGGTITSIDISYMGEEWRLGTAGRTDRIDFEISTNATDLTTGTYTAVDPLDFTTPNTSTVGAKDGNAVGNRIAISSSITGLSIASGATFFIRWTDFNATLADDGLAVDDFSLTANGNPGDTAPLVNSTMPTNGATNVAADANISITFSENVNVGSSWFEISCTTSGSRQVTDTSVTGGPLTFTIDPNTDFAGSEMCTVTVFANQVSDQDVNDPPDQMQSNAVFSFTVATPPPPVAENIIINELDSDTPGADTLEFVELYDGGVGNTSLTGLVVVFYNGSNDLSYAAFDLDGFSTDANGYFVLGNTVVPGRDLVFADNLLQNGADAVALYAGDATSFPNNTAVTTTNLKDAVVYDTDDADDAGLLVLLNPGEPQVNENAGGGGTTNSIGRCPNGGGGFRNTSSYTARTPTPDAVNNCPPPPIVLTIPQIQGSGTASPYDGVSVTTSGIVTGRKTNGFFLQDPAGDADPATSDAVFVFTSTAPSGVTVGDLVQVTGEVSEFEASDSDEPDGASPPDPKTATEITSPTILVMSSGNALPAALDSTALNIFDPTAASRGAELERYEFMRVSVSSITVSEPTNNFGEFWGVEPPRVRPFREPGIERGDPIPAADEGPFAGFPPPNPPIFDGNFERVMVDSDDAVISFGPTVRRPPISVTTGAVVTGITGPLDYGFNNYRVVLDAMLTPGVTPGVTAATPVPVRTSGEFTIAHANLENFGVSNGNFADRLNKASLAIRNVLRTPDILGVIEVFDLPSLQQLAAKVNADVGNPSVANYQAYLDESASTFGDSQDVGYLVNTARVTVIGAPVQYHRTDTFTYCGNTDLLHDRPSYILTADVPQAGTSELLRVTVILNHTKSLIAVDSPQPSGICGTGTVGARNREKRRLQAEDIADLIESLQNENLVVLGDLNAFDFNDGLTDVVGTLKGNPAPADQVVEPSTDRWSYQLTNLIPTLAPDQRYSLLFEGNAQALDHVLVNNKMLARNTRIAYARYNADFSESFAADATRPERLSDHDAPVAYFAPLADLSVTKSASPEPVVTGSDVTYTITVANNGPDAAAGVTVSDNLPAEITFVSCNATGGGVCGGAGNNRTVTFSSLSSGASETITLVATADCEVTNGEVISNTATVGSATNDPNSSNNSDTAMTTASDPPPELNCPADITTEPTCPSGAIVTYAAPVGTDNCSGVTTELTAGLASGSVFPIGTTTVTYTATDGNGQTASCSFTVTVLTPQQVVQNLINTVNGYSNLSAQKKQSLITKLQAALDAINSGKTNVACNKLNDFISQVQAYVNNGSLTPAQGQSLIDSANHVRNTIGCTNFGCT